MEVQSITTGRTSLWAFVLGFTFVDEALRWSAECECRASFVKFILSLGHSPWSSVPWPLMLHHSSTTTWWWWWWLIYICCWSWRTAYRTDSLNLQRCQTALCCLLLLLVLLKRVDLGNDILEIQHWIRWWLFTRFPRHTNVWKVKFLLILILLILLKLKPLVPTLSRRSCSSSIIIKFK